MRKSLLFILVWAFCLNLSTAQESYAKWVEPILNLDESHGDVTSIITSVCEQGDYIYVNGFYRGDDIEFCGQSLEEESSHLQYNGFVAKMDKEGELQWLSSIYGIGNESFIDIAVDSKGDVIAVGYPGGVGYEEDGTDIYINGEIVLEKNGLYEHGLIAKFSGENGELVWNVAWTSAANKYANPSRITVDADDNLYIAGYYTDEFDVGPNESGNEYVPYKRGNVSENTFFMKLSSEGKFIWANSIDAENDMYGAIITPKSISVKDNQLYLGFIYGLSAMIGNEVLPFETGSYWSGIAKINAETGEFLDYTYFGVGNGHHEINQLSVDKKGDLIVGGYFVANRGHKMDDFPLNGYGDSSDYTDGFVAKLGADLKVKWVTQIGGSYEDRAFTISIAEDNTIMVGGGFDSGDKLKVNDEEVLTSREIPENSWSIYMIRLDESGDFINVRGLYGHMYYTNISSSSTAVDSEGRIFTGGSFAGDVYFTPGELSSTSYNIVVDDETGEEEPTTATWGYIMEWNDGVTVNIEQDYLDPTSGFSTYPNPTTDRIIVDIPENEAAVITIVDLTGKLVYSGGISSRTVIDISNFANGTYLLKAETKNSQSTHKIIKK